MKDGAGAKDTRINMLKRIGCSIKLAIKNTGDFVR